MGPFRWNPIAVTMSQAGESRNDEWNSDRPKDESQGYDGPAGMEPDGLIESNWEEICENFDDMNLKEELLRGIYAYGFEKPSAIQQRAIVPCIKGFDVIAQAQSGTGKTATFSISILQQVKTSIKDCQALILASYKIQNITNVETDTFKKHLDDWLRTIPDTPKIDSYGASVPAASNSIVDQCMTKW